MNPFLMVLISYATRAVYQRELSSSVLPQHRSRNCYRFLHPLCACYSSLWGDCAWQRQFWIHLNVVQIVCSEYRHGGRVFKLKQDLLKSCNCRSLEFACREVNV